MKTIFKTIKFLWKPLAILAGVVILLVAGGMLIRGCGCGDQPQPSATQAPPGWQPVPIQKTPIFPFKKNTASEKTEGFPAGSKVVVVETQNGEQVEVGILPGGEVVVPEGTTAVVYEKRPPIINAEFRPWLGGGATVYPEVRPAAAVGVDVLRVWRVHTGPGVCVDSGAFSGVWTGSVGLWRNVDARAGGGYGTSGATGFAGVTIGIE